MGGTLHINMRYLRQQPANIIISGDKRQRMLRQTKLFNNRIGKKGTRVRSQSGVLSAYAHGIESLPAQFRCVIKSPSDHCQAVDTVRLAYYI